MCRNVCKSVFSFFFPQRNRRQFGYNAALLPIPPSHFRSWLIPAQPRAPSRCAAAAAAVTSRAHTFSTTSQRTCSGLDFQNKKLKKIDIMASICSTFRGYLHILLFLFLASKYQILQNNLYLGITFNHRVK